MTPTEIKAEEIASEFEGLFYDDFSSSIIHNEMAIKCCDKVIEVLSSVKGMGKIHKVNLYKLVKKNLEAK